MHRDQIEALFYGRPENQRRFTQDFPILPDVWIEYGKDPAGRVEVLLTPHNESDAPAVLPDQVEHQAHRCGRRVEDPLHLVARGALESERPGWAYSRLYLVLVDDKPGVAEDRAHFVAVGESGDETRVVLGRQDGDWVAESVE